MIRNPIYRLASLVAIALFFGAGFIPAQAAEPAFETELVNETPLIVIRFNQPRVHYEQPLYSTISRALQAKPTAMFDIVSVAPKAPDSRDQEHYNQIAYQNTSRIMAALRQMGLPQSRIVISNSTDDIRSSETRIFVH